MTWLSTLAGRREKTEDDCAAGQSMGESWRPTGTRAGALRPSLGVRKGF